MTNDKGILIKNIYYMMSYAFQVLKQKNYDEIASEKFKDIGDLFAAILAKGISVQLKQGLYREYIARNEILPVMRGRLDIERTMSKRIQHKAVVACEYDELSENNIYNSVLKTTASILIKNKSVKPERRAALKKVMLFFNDIDVIEPSCIQWNTFKYGRNSRNYEMLMNVCYFVLDGMLQTTEKGKYKMVSFTDEHMARLYEKFVLEYYKRNHKYLTEAKPTEIKWNLDGEIDKKMIRFLPVMQTDITLAFKDRTLIIDTKYYGKTMQTQYGKTSFHSNNLYQIFTYVKNYDYNNTGKTAGVLLYAKTNESVTPDSEFSMGGNEIKIKTLDLNADFKDICRQLDEIAYEYFGEPKIS